MKTFLSIIAIIVLTVLGSYFIISSSKSVTVPRDKIRRSFIPIPTKTISFKEHQLEISGYGLLLPLKRTIIRPQVTGKIISIAKGLKVGGFFKKNDLLVSIEPDDYLIELMQKKANLASAELAYRQEEAQQEIARKEWQYIDKKVRQETTFKDLVLRERQLIEKAAQVQAAKGLVRKAELNIKRTKLRAPFDGVIISHDVALEELVSSSNKLINFASYNSFKITASISRESLPLLLPITTTTFATIKNITTNHITLSTSLDSRSKMAQILVEFENKTDHKDLFLLNDFIKVSFSSKKLNAYKIENEYVRSNDTLWIKTEDNTLDILSLKVITKQNKYTYFTLHKPNEDIKVITSFIALPYIGMKILR